MMQITSAVLKLNFFIIFSQPSFQVKKYTQKKKSI